MRWDELQLNNVGPVSGVEGLRVVIVDVCSGVSSMRVRGVREKGGELAPEWKLGRTETRD